MKEEGSYTDNNKPLDHVYRLIADSPKNKIVCNTKEQVSTLLSSAIYQTTWNSNDPEVIKLEKSADRIVKQLRKLNLY